jgi:hypothetical protein
MTSPYGLSATLNLVVETRFGVTDTTIYLSSVLSGQEYISFTDEAAREHYLSTGGCVSSRQYIHHIALEVNTNRDAVITEEKK